MSKKSLFDPYGPGANSTFSSIRKHHVLAKEKSMWLSL